MRKQTCTLVLAGALSTCMLLEGVAVAEGQETTRKITVECALPSHIQGERPAACQLLIRLYEKRHGQRPRPVDKHEGTIAAKERSKKKKVVFSVKAEKDVHYFVTILVPEFRAEPWQSGYFHVEQPFVLNATLVSADEGSESMRAAVRIARLSYEAYDPTSNEAKLLKVKDEELSRDFVTKKLLGSEIRSGALAGGFKLNPAAAGMSFHRTAVGLQGLVRDQKSLSQVEAFLDLWLSRADADGGWIDDAATVASGTLSHTRNDCDCAATSAMMMLVDEFSRTNPGASWWNANGPKVSKIAEKVLLGSQTNGGLMRMHAPSRPNGNFSTAPLVSNCQSYGGMKAIERVYTRNKDELTAAKFAAAADRLAKGIARLYHEPAGAFYLLESEVGTPFNAAGIPQFHPHRYSQVYPELFNVPLGDPTTTKARYDSAWAYMNAGGTWAGEFPTDGSTGSFPLMQLGYLAARRGQRDLAVRQFEWFEQTLSARPPVYEFQFVDELGYALRMLDELWK